MENTLKIKDIDQKLTEIIKLRNEKIEKEEQAQKAKQTQEKKVQK